METAILNHDSPSPIGRLFLRLQLYIQARQHPIFIGHLRSHSKLPGPLALGNQKTDQAIRLHPIVTPASSHAIHHQNSRALQRQFGITREAARQIVKTCPACAPHLSVPQLGINPRGPLE